MDTNQEERDRWIRGSSARSRERYARIQENRARLNEIFAVLDEMLPEIKRMAAS